MTEQKTHGCGWEHIPGAAFPRQKVPLFLFLQGLPCLFLQVLVHLCPFQGRLYLFLQGLLCPFQQVLVHLCPFQGRLYLFPQGLPFPCLLSQVPLFPPQGHLFLFLWQSQQIKLIACRTMMLQQSSYLFLLHALFLHRLCQTFFNKRFVLQKMTSLELKLTAPQQLIRRSFQTFFKHQVDSGSGTHTKIKCNLSIRDY